VALRLPAGEGSETGNIEVIEVVQRVTFKWLDVARQIEGNRTVGSRRLSVNEEAGKSAPTD